MTKTGPLSRAQGGFKHLWRVGETAFSFLALGCFMCEPPREQYNTIMWQGRLSTCPRPIYICELYKHAHWRLDWGGGLVVLGVKTGAVGRSGHSEGITDAVKRTRGTPYHTSMHLAPESHLWGGWRGCEHAYSHTYREPGRDLYEHTFGHITRERSAACPCATKLVTPPRAP